MPLNGRNPVKTSPLQRLVLLALLSVSGGVARGAAAPTSATSAPATTAPATAAVPVVDGIVQPRRPLADAIADAMRFFKKSDGGYVPGNLAPPAPLAGYFTSAHVLEDGSPSSRKFSFPARQHAYFINTFL